MFIGMLQKSFITKVIEKIYMFMKIYMYMCVQKILLLTEK